MPMTAAEFEKLKDPPGALYELRHGEPIPVPYPRKLEHEVRQAILLQLHEAIGAYGFVSIRIGFRPTPEYNVLAADVAFVSRGRWAATGDDEWLSGSPEIVVYVLLPSSGLQDMNDREQLCLNSGCRQFWVVDPDLKLVKITTPDGVTPTYRSGSTISLAEFGGESIAVDSLFTE
jgi:hypothetical protein